MSLILDGSLYTIDIVMNFAESSEMNHPYLRNIKSLPTKLKLFLTTFGICHQDKHLLKPLL